MMTPKPTSTLFSGSCLGSIIKFIFKFIVGVFVLFGKLFVFLWKILGWPGRIILILIVAVWLFSDDSGGGGGDDDDIIIMTAAMEEERRRRNS